MELLRVYHFYMRTLSMELLPSLVHRVLGRTGFGSLARLYAETTRKYIERYIGGASDPEELLRRLVETASTAQRLLGEEPLFNFTVSRRGRDFIIEASLALRDEVDELGPQYCSA